MISGASEEELIEAIGRADVLLEFMPKIKQLQQEKEQLSKEIDVWNKKYNDMFDENKQLKDNWNKLKEIIKKKIVAQGGFTSYEWNDLLNELLDKMQELEKGSDSDE